MTSGSVAAVDLGATSGRVILGHVDGSALQLQHVARFPNRPVPVFEEGRPGLHWDILGLRSAVSDGLAEAVRQDPAVASIGVDSWAVDYGLLRRGRLVGLPYNYRDDRSAGGVSAVHQVLPAAELYRRTGLAHCRSTRCSSSRPTGPPARSRSPTGPSVTWETAQVIRFRIRCHARRDHNRRGVPGRHLLVDSAVGISLPISAITCVVLALLYQNHMRPSADLGSR